MPLPAYLQKCDLLSIAKNFAYENGNADDDQVLEAYFDNELEEDVVLDHPQILFYNLF